MLIHKIRETCIAQPDDFGSMCTALLQRIHPGKLIANLVFFGDPADNREYHANRKTLNDIIVSLFKASAPPFAYIAQKPLTGGLLLEACLIEEHPGQSIVYKTHSDINYTSIQNGACRELIIGGAMSGDPHAGPYKQAADVFSRIGAIFAKEEMPVDSIVRQWNYIEQITKISIGRQNYQEFNRARSGFYDLAPWENGYPAATGIGTRAGGIIVRLEALGCFDRSIKNIAINNNLQVPAHQYSGEVLAGKNGDSCRPKFERARLIASAHYSLLHVSGTAAIRGEMSMAAGDAVRQVRITMENISNLISDESLEACGFDTGKKPWLHSVVVYLKNEPDYKDIKRFMDHKFPAANPVYLVADLCRDELLVEIEADFSLEH